MSLLKNQGCTSKTFCCLNVTFFFCLRGKSSCPKRETDRNSGRKMGILGNFQVFKNPEFRNFEEFGYSEFRNFEEFRNPELKKSISEVRNSWEFSKHTVISMFFLYTLWNSGNLRKLTFPRFQ